MLVRNLLFTAAASMLVAACGGEAMVNIPEEPGKSASEVVGNPSADPKLYPTGPTGFSVGYTIPNMSFVGLADTNGNGKVNDDAPVKISLSDYYGKKDVKLVALLFAAEWCPPCQQEQGELVSSWNRYQMERPGEVAYLEALTESSDAKRSPADLGTLDRWTGKAWTDFQVKPNKTGLYLPFPVVADPTKNALRLGASAIPTQIIIRTSDMQIVWFNQGYGKGVLEGNIDDQLSQL